MFAVQQLHKRAIALLLIPALLVAESALAVTRVDEAPSVTVRYYDLNLKSTQGVASLYGRIHRAAVDVCRPSDGEINKLETSAWNECVAHSVADAVRRIHNEKLSAYQWERVRGWKFRSVDAPINVAER
jgi:UrcA family protein